MGDMAHKPGETSLQAWTATRLKDALDRLVMDVRQRGRVSESRQAVSSKSVVSALLAEFMKRGIEEQERFLVRWLPIYEEDYYEPSKAEYLSRKSGGPASDEVPVKLGKGKVKSKGKTG